MAHYAEIADTAEAKKDSGGEPTTDVLVAQNEKKPIHPVNSDQYLQF